MAPGPYVRLEVTDTGSGMAPEVLARALDPFFTTKPVGQGTGLGLSMVHGFVSQSGGAMRLRSAPGRGTTVALFLPRSDGGPAPAKEAARAEAPRPARAASTVLVVDDEPAVRALVVETLHGLGDAALEAGDARAALGILRAGTRVDLLITDVGLPGGMNGRQLAEAARTARPGLAVLFITGYAEAAVGELGRLGDGMQVMTKPFALDDLAARITAMIGDRPVRPGLGGADARAP